MQTVRQYNKPHDKAHDKDHNRKIFGVYIKSLLTIKIAMSINEIGKNVKQNLEKKIISQISGKCPTEFGENHKLFVRKCDIRFNRIPCGV